MQGASRHPKSVSRCCRILLISVSALADTNAALNGAAEKPLELTDAEIAISNAKPKKTQFLPTKKKFAKNMIFRSDTNFKNNKFDTNMLKLQQVLH